VLEDIIFYFNDRSSLPDATGTLKDDLLEIRFSEIMQHSDFGVSNSPLCQRARALRLIAAAT
jgi:hypothetical protein